MKIKDGWKVVREWRRGNGKLISARGLGEVHTYSYKKFIKPREGCGPFAVFKTKLAAREWYCSIDQKVVKCKYVESPEEDLYCPGTCRYEIRRNYGFARLPLGTVLASRVKLVR